MTAPNNDPPAPPALAPVPQRPRTARALLTLLAATGLVLGGIWLQKTLWPQAAPPRDPRALNEQLFPVKTPFRWDAPPLPPQSAVEFRLEKGSAAAGDRRLQLFCSSPLPPERIRAFYEAELAAAGWKKYNDSPANAAAAAGAGVGGGLYRMGNLSLALHIFPGKTGGKFRLSVVTVAP